METSHLILQGLTCDACTKIIKKRLLQNIEGVLEIEVQKKRRCQS